LNTPKTYTKTVLCQQEIYTTSEAEFGIPELCWISQQASSRSDTAFSIPCCVTVNQMTAKNTANSNRTFIIRRVERLMHDTKQMSSDETEALNYNNMQYAMNFIFV